MRRGETQETNDEVRLKIDFVIPWDGNNLNKTREREILGEDKEVVTSIDIDK